MFIMKILEKQIIKPKMYLNMHIFHGKQFRTYRHPTLKKWPRPLRF